MTTCICPSRVEGSVHRTRQELADLLPEWLAFLETSPLGTRLFNDPRYLEAHLQARDSDTPYIIVVRENGDIKCIVPFVITASSYDVRLSVMRLLSRRARVATLFGGAMIIERNASSDTYFATMLESLEKLKHACDIISAFGMDFDDPLWRHWRRDQRLDGSRRSPPARLSRNVSFEIALPNSFEEYAATLGNNTRKSLARRKRKLFDPASNGRNSLVKVTSQDDVPAFLNAVDDVFRDTWQAKTYGFYSRCTKSEIGRLQAVATHGWLRSYLLVADDEPIAFQIGYQYQETFYACEFGFKRAWAEKGPGAVLMFAMFEDLFLENSPLVIDLGDGDSPQKRTFRGACKTVGTAQFGCSQTWRCLLAMQRAIDCVESPVRRALTAAHLDDVVRRILKRKVK